MHALGKYRYGGFLALVVSEILRHYRRMRRFIVRLCMADVRVPRYMGLYAVFFLLFAVFVYGINVGGHGYQVVRFVTNIFGFSLEKVEVVGNHRLSHDEVVAILGVDDKTSLLGFDVVAARDALSSLPWVQSVDVQKVYPNNLRVSLVERQPFAVWQHGDVLEIVDREGQVIARYKPGLISGLPLVVGGGAQKKAADFVSEVALNFPEMEGRVRAYIRVSGRRWDIVLQNGVRIKLPEENAIKRLADVVAADKATGLLSRDIMSVDLRLHDRMTVLLSDEALMRRAEVVKEEERLLKAKKAGHV